MIGGWRMRVYEAKRGKKTPKDDRLWADVSELKTTAHLS